MYLIFWRTMQVKTVTGVIFAKRFPPLPIRPPSKGTLQKRKKVFQYMLCYTDAGPHLHSLEISLVTKTRTVSFAKGSRCNVLRQSCPGTCPSPSGIDSVGSLVFPGKATPH